MPQDTTGATSGAGEKKILRASLRDSRDAMLWKLEGLGERDRRRPLTPTGTNLLGLVKHLAGLEYGYLGGVFGRPASESLPWVEDGSIWEGADMWATAEESTEYLTGLYRRACAHADETIDALTLDTIGTVPWWKEGEQEITLLGALVRMIAETARHAGHADIVRELIDGSAGSGRRDSSLPDLGTEAGKAYVARIADAAAAAERATSRGV